jgi:phospholipid/cholesterol/gamma-HCH transport system permease protein
MSVPECYYQAIDAVAPIDLVQGFVKSFVFAAIISAVGCMRGFEASNDAQGVGRASTSAVVTAIFLIILTDAIITAEFCY